MTAPLPAGGGSGAAEYSPGALAGRAPTAAAVRAAKRSRTKALLVWGIPIVLLLAGLYWRLAVSTLPLRLGVVSWVLPAAIAAVVAAVLWALIVEPNSRGNALGDQLRASAGLDAQTVAENDRLLAEGRQIKEHGEMCAEVVQAELLEAHERVTDVLEMSHRALQVATAALGVPDVPTVRPENLMRPTMPHIERIEAKAGTEIAAQREMATQLGIEHMPALEALPSPHHPFGDPADVAAGTDHFDPRGLPSFPGSTLGGYADGGEPPAPRHRLRRVLLILLVIASLAAALVWFLVSRGVSSLAAVAPAPIPSGSTTSGATAAAPTATLVAAHPSPPAGIREGVDYAFLDRRSDGALVRWSCTTRITVRLAGPAPSGAAATLVGAVAALRTASGLPLVVGSPMPKVVTNAADVPANTIAYSYLTTAEIAQARLDLTGDVLGEGGPQFDPATGDIESGWVVIRADGSADPNTTLGKEVAWHEGAHTLNLGHALQNSPHAEIMAPSADGTGPLAFGPGDRYALAAVGCTTSR